MNSTWDRAIRAVAAFVVLLLLTMYVGKPLNRWFNGIFRPIVAPERQPSPLPPGWRVERLP